MLYVKLDSNWPDNPKVVAAGIDGAGLHSIAMCLAKRLETNGWIHRELLRRQGAADELIDRLVSIELLDADGALVRPHDWLRHNPSQAAIAAKRMSKQEAGRKGNHDRWHGGVPFDACPKCQVIAGSDRIGSDCDPKSSPKPEPEPEGGPATLTLLDLAMGVVSQHHDELTAMLDSVTSAYGVALVRSHLEHLIETDELHGFPSGLRKSIDTALSKSRVVERSKQSQGPRGDTSCPDCAGAGGAIVDTPNSIHGEWTPCGCTRSRKDPAA